VKGARGGVRGAKCGIRAWAGESLHPKPYTLNSILVTGFAFLCGVLTTTVSEGVILDRVVAVVNDDVITLTEVQEEGLQTIRRIVQETLGDERERRLRSTERQILDDLILRKLQLQEAKKEKVEATA
jgi:SurA-like N-terminal domain